MNSLQLNMSNRHAKTPQTTINIVFIWLKQNWAPRKLVINVSSLFIWLKIFRKKKLKSGERQREGANSIGVRWLWTQWRECARASTTLAHSTTVCTQHFSLWSLSKASFCIWICVSNERDAYYLATTRAQVRIRAQRPRQNNTTFHRFDIGTDNTHRWRSSVCCSYYSHNDDNENRYLSASQLNVYGVWIGRQRHI